MNDLSAVHVPDAADEAFRDLVRVWSAARQDLAKAKQRLKSFLLVHDVRYTGKANWGAAHRRWLAQSFSKDEFSARLSGTPARDRGSHSPNASACKPCCRSPPFIGASIPSIAPSRRCAASNLTWPSDSSPNSASCPASLQHRRSWLAGDDAERILHWRTHARRDHQMRQRSRTSALIEATWAYRYPPKVSPSIQQRHEGLPKASSIGLGCAAALVQTLSQTHRTRQAAQCGPGRRRARTRRLHLGHRTHQYCGLERALLRLDISTSSATESVCYRAQPR